MKKLIFLPILLFMVLKVAAQELFVEVVISDTIQLEIEKIIYKVHISGQVDYTRFDYADPANQDFGGNQAEKMADLLEEREMQVRRILTAEKANLEDSKLETGQVGLLGTLDNTQSNTIAFSVKTPAQLYSIVDQLSEIYGVTGNVHRVHPKSSVKKEEALLERMMKAGREKAERLARAENRTIGELLQIQEMDGETYEDPYAQSLAQLYQNIWRGMAGTGNGLTPVYSQKYRLRYELVVPGR